MKEIVNDRIIAGLIAGSIGGLIMELINNFLYIVGITKLRAVDYVMILIKQQPVNNLPEFIFGMTGHLVNAGLPAVILAYVLFKTNYCFPIIKGILMGITVNIHLHYLASLFNLKLITNASIISMLILHYSAIIYGGIAGYLLYYFHRNYSLT